MTNFRDGRSRPRQHPDTDNQEWILRLLTPPEWHRQAACRPPAEWLPERVGEHIKLFFPDRGAQSTVSARSYCDVCPVAAQCADTPRAGREHGIWGGETSRQRQKRFRGAPNRGGGHFSDRQIRAIRTKYDGGDSVANLARMYEVHTKTIYAIVARRSYTHVTEETEAE